MKRVHIAQSVPEAYLLKGFLEDNGIPATVEGEHLQAIVGGIPVYDACPWVCVPEGDYERAQALVEEFLAGSLG